MKIVLCCDVDPILPQHLREVPGANVWKCLENIENLVIAKRKELPPITWLIRCDESVRFCTAKFASGFFANQALWETLLSDGHELGWHFHPMSFSDEHKCFTFDPDPPWLPAARDALSINFNVQLTRTGWDYASNLLFQRLEELGIVMDLSALPGNIIWQWVGPDKIEIDWLRAPTSAYHPSRQDYQRPGELRILELPVAQFRNSPLGIIKRMLWRMKNGCYSTEGLKKKTKTLTDHWGSLPLCYSSILVFFFHPYDLKGKGFFNFLSNLDLLYSLPNADFARASAVLG